MARKCPEHILIYYSEQPRKQVWQWATRLPHGRKLRHREHPFFSHSVPAAFVKGLSALRFTPEEEAALTLSKARQRVRRLLDRPADQNLFSRRPWYSDRSADLAVAMQTGDVEAFHRFLLFHLPLARKFSKRFCRWFAIPPEDAEQIAVVGLIKAARRFRPELGYQFSTYASRWIDRAWQQFGPRFAFLIRVPNHVLWPCFRLRSSLEQMAGEVGETGVRQYLTELDFHDPTTARQFRDFERATTILSLSDRKQPEYRAAHAIAEPSSDPFDDLKDDARIARVHKAVARLRPRDAQIIRLRYGFDGCPPQTLAEIGKLMGLTRERIRQLQVRAERRLRKYFAEESDRPAVNVSDDRSYAEDRMSVTTLVVKVSPTPCKKAPSSASATPIG